MVIVLRFGRAVSARRGNACPNGLSKHARSRCRFTACWRRARLVLMRGIESVVGPTGGKQDGDTVPSLDQDAAQLLALRALVESLDDIVFTLDTNQRHDGVYGHWLREAGLGPEAFLGRTARQILGADAALVHESANEQALAGRRVTYEWNLPTRSGSRRIQTSLVPRRASSGEIDGVVGIGRDITAQVDVQARQVVSDRMTSIGILAAGIAHE